MNDSPDVSSSPARAFWDPARPVVPALGLLSVLHWAELLALPLLVFATQGWPARIAAVGLGVAARAARLLLHQHARRRVRRAFMQHAALASLRLREPAPAGSDAAFWGAHISEYALCVDIPALIGATLTCVVVAPMAASRLGATTIATLAAVLVSMLALGLLGNRLRRPQVDAVVERRYQMAIWMAAATDDVGEMGSRRATRAFLDGVTHRAEAWTSAEDTLERRRALQLGLTIALAVSILFLLGELRGFAAAFMRAPSWDALSGFLLVGALLPAAYSLNVHLESLMVARSEVTRLFQRQGAVHQRGSLRLSESPRVLCANGLSVSYGQQLALDLPMLRLDLTRPTVITGPNGAGKTTFAKLIAGLSEPTLGTLTLDGVATSQLSADDIAYVPQNPVLIDALSVMENLRLVAPDCSPNDARDVLAALNAPRLDKILDEKVGAFSRGESRRIATARALLTPARVIVLDEPDAFLDTASRQALVAVLRERAARSTIVMVSHRLDVIHHFDQIVALSAEHSVEAIGDRDAVVAASASFRELSRSQAPLAPSA